MPSRRSGRAGQVSRGLTQRESRLVYPMQSLSLLSYNIQAGIHSRQYSDYLTNSWKHFLPYRERLDNLTRIASLLRGYDLVGLQEVDSGSLRSAYVDQVQFLAASGGFPYWHRQVNRNLGMLAQHSNGILSRVRPDKVTEHKLPGLPGRGAVVAEFALSDGEDLAVCILHLALGRRARDAVGLSLSAHSSLSLPGNDGRFQL